MNTTRELNYYLYLQKTSGFNRAPLNSEFEQYMAIRSGDVEGVKRHLAAIRNDFLKGKGRLSEDPLRNIVYHFVTSVALISRVCIEGGLSHDTAYTLSDIYIRKADKCKVCDELIGLFEEMQTDFAERMRDLRKDNIISLHIRRCIDHIYEHLNENLTVKGIAEQFDLSKLFHKEVGLTISAYITKKRIEAAENMLKFSDHSYLDIALSLGFSSQSAFISVFKKVKGVTPKKYKEDYYMCSFKK